MRNKRGDGAEPASRCAITGNFRRDVQDKLFTLKVQEPKIDRVPHPRMDEGESGKYFINGMA